jgi:hypothetical protein
VARVRVEAEERRYLEGVDGAGGGRQRQHPLAERLLGRDGRRPWRPVVRCPEKKKTKEPEPMVLS